MKKIPFLLSFALACIMLAVSGCSSDELEEPTSDVYADTHITVMFGPAALGDRGYNDLILRGVQKTYMTYPGVRLSLAQPQTMAEAEAEYDKWLARVPEAGCRRDLFVLASSDYETLASHVTALNAGTSAGREVLLFESSNLRRLPLTTFTTSLYGASWLAGRAVANLLRMDPMVMGPYEGEPVTAGAIEGFCDGYGSVIEAVVSRFYLSDNASGFDMAAEAYRRMSQWEQDHYFIFPVAGGSNAGVYRYLREYPKSMYTAGMDVDQSGVCANVMVNIVKRMDALTELYLSTWIETGAFPGEHVYGVESGYVDCTVSPNFTEVLEDIINVNREEAIRHEKEYISNM